MRDICLCKKAFWEKLIINIKNSVYNKTDDRTEKNQIHKIA